MSIKQEHSVDFIVSKFWIVKSRIEKKRKTLQYRNGKSISIRCNNSKIFDSWGTFLWNFLQFEASNGLIWINLSQFFTEHVDTLSCDGFDKIRIDKLQQPPSYADSTLNLPKIPHFDSNKSPVKGKSSIRAIYFIVFFILFSHVKLINDQLTKSM